MMKRSHRRALTLFRSGTAPINLELLHYGVNHAPVELRKCISCNEVENECHVLLQCHLYNDIRELFYNSIQDTLTPDDYIAVMQSDDIDKSNLMLSSPLCVKLVARTL